MRLVKSCLAAALSSFVLQGTNTLKMSSFSANSNYSPSVDFSKDVYYDAKRIAAVTKIPELQVSATQIFTRKSSVKCYCLSDLHADTENNQKYVRDNCVKKEEDEDAFTVFIVPGDIGSEVDRIETVLKVLVENYDAVCYVPGNHEAWRRGTLSGGSATNPSLRADSRMAPDSVAKLKEIIYVANRCGVYTGPLRVVPGASSESKFVYQTLTENDNGGTLIMPLYSWYHSSWDTEPVLTDQLFLDVEEAIPFKTKWGDFNLCSWPEQLVTQEEFASIESKSTALAESFAQLNEPFLHPPGEGIEAVQESLGSPLCRSGDTIISFSHFLPRQELCPEKRFMIEPFLSRVVGSDVLESQVRRLQPHVHLFGHTHIPIDLELDGIRYVQWPLGYRKEATLQCGPVFRNGPLLVHDSVLGSGTVGIPRDMLSTTVHWTAYYRGHARNPDNVKDLAPWVIKRLEQFSGFVYTSKKRAAVN